MEEITHDNVDLNNHDDTAPLTEEARLMQERDEYLDGWQRARADLANYKRDEAKRLDDMMKFSNGALVRELIMVVDNFDLAIAAMEKHGGVEQGIYLIKAQLEDVLKQYGLERMTVTVGQIFDPAMHEAIVLVASELASGSVVEEVDRGYYLHGKLIRPARVKVAE